MGTNFYLKRRLNKQQKEEIKKLIDSDGDYYEIVDKLYDCHPVHIGKRSCGWRFLWDCHYFEHFEPNEESIKKFLQSGQIVDEYKEEFTYDQFINEEIGQTMTEGLTLEEYYKDPLNKPTYIHYAPKDELERFEEYKDDIQIDPYGEFEIGNMRFTIYEDFG